jgi:RNA polymerase sigma factor (sigma-70 family)
MTLLDPARAPMVATPEPAPENEATAGPSPGTTIDLRDAETPDAALVTRLVEGDEAALERLYDLFAGPVYALALRVTGDEPLAQDAVQDAFLALWRLPLAFDPTRGSLQTFLMTLVHRRAVDIVRREGRQRRQRIPEAVLLDLPDLEPGPEELIEVRDRAGEVRRALAELPEAQRRTLALAYFEGRTQREIAALTDTPLGTVKTRMVAAVRALRIVLVDLGEAQV